MKSKEQISERESRSVSSSFRPHGLYSIAGQTTGVASLSLLQGRQGLNPCLPHCRRILYHLSQKGSPRILEWVAYPFSSRFSQRRNRTRVSCIAGRFFTVLATQLVKMKVRVVQSWPTLCDSMDYTVHGIL